MKTQAVWVALIALGCGGPARSTRSTTTPMTKPAPASTPTPKPASTPTPKPGPKAKKDDPLFPATAPRGWKELAADERAAADQLADDYVSFISRGKTPRRAIAALVEIAEEAGARVAADDDAQKSGFHYTLLPSGDAAVFYRAGSRPVANGLSVIVVSVDAPRLVLKQQATTERHRFEVLETDAHGDLDLRSWLVHPIAIDLYAVKRGKPIAFSIGEAESDPVLSIPDLLPHLSRGSQQRGREVADAEKLDPLSASRPGALAKLLASRDLTLADLTSTEASLVPAGPAYRVGVDRAIIGGYGHGHRALAFAAIRALGETTPTRAAAVIVVGRSEDGGGSGTGYPIVGRMLRSVIASLSEGPMDVYANSVAISQTTALVGQRSSGQRNAGVVIDIASADALPLAANPLASALRAANVPFKLVDKAGEGVGRDLASLDLDAIGLAIPTSGGGAPGETVSVLDLFHGAAACRAWLARP